MRRPQAIAASCLLGAAVAVLAGVTASAVQAPGVPLTAEYRPPPAPEQPIPYSHKTHLAQGLQCMGCHETADSAERAALPPTNTCMGCHTKVRTDSAHIQALKGWHEKGEAVPWRRVYRLPNFVYFSHKQHVADAKVGCDVCHGEVAQMDQMQKVKDTSMAACVDCHKSHSAPEQCDSCHEPL
jgi:predicted CXXCH cytochrome family protein